MKHFQDLGHTAIFLIGDFTGLIGDPSGRSVTRKQLTKEEVLQNAETYKQQIFKILDPEKTVIDFNSRWMSAASAPKDSSGLRRDIPSRAFSNAKTSTNRMKNQQPIAMHELLYPLVQGYDSVALEADVELGGTDQKFNLAGRPRSSARIRTGIADRADDAAARRYRRRAEDEQVAGQLHRDQRNAAMNNSAKSCRSPMT